MSFEFGRCGSPLSPKQVKAIEFLLSGHTLTATARYVSVTQRTLSRWMQAGHKFKKELDEAYYQMILGRNNLVEIAKEGKGMAGFQANLILAGIKYADLRATQAEFNRGGNKVQVYNKLIGGPKA